MKNAVCKDCSRPIICRLPRQVRICADCAARREALTQAQGLDEKGEHEDAKAVRTWADVLADRARSKGGWFPGETPPVEPGEPEDAYLSHEQLLQVAKAKAKAEHREMRNRIERERLERRRQEVPVRMGRPPRPVDEQRHMIGYRVTQAVRAKLTALGGRDWLEQAVLAAPLPRERP